MLTPEQEKEFAITVETLMGPLPDVARCLRSKNPRLAVRLKGTQLRQLARALWIHGHEYGRAAEIDRQQEEGLD